MLANGQVDALNESRVDLPARGGQHLRDPLQGAEHHAVPHTDHASAAIRLDDLRIKQLWQWHPSGLWWGACIPLAWGLYPVAKVGQQCRAVILEPVGEKEGHAARGQHRNNLM